ncbi:LysR family transcriptional regulator ArgP [Solidesulfovibrio sp.]|uniref:LysR family transcriptional regulator ArgP n=1 Tax=Solidesulfovibrio sp. TaxID=2910990 RepID=UPI0026043397|nr:LysR family transcriptional regulator ArgP [Solidesulfovibrio sp.]
MIDVNMLEALGSVLEHGGFEKAAKSLFISQSAVSQRIKQLEESIGQVLIVRSSPPKATPAGKQLLKYYKQVKYLEEDVLSRLGFGSKERYSILAIGVNADSLSTWLFDIVNEFFKINNVLFNLIVDDQEETHKLLKDGDVVGCISASNVIVQGCSCDYLGAMQYKFAANPTFCKKWFDNGINYISATDAPIVNFNTKDTIHHQLFKNIFQKVPSEFNSHYVPSPEQLLRAVASGLGYGAVPSIQAESYFRAGELIDLFPGIYVDINLYWHYWNIDLRFLKKFTKSLTEQSKLVLKPY